MNKGLWTNSSWFLWIRVEVLYEALVVKHKWGTHKQHKHIYDTAIWCNAQSNRERELEKVDQSQTHGYVSRFEHTALRPLLHTEGFPLTCPHRTPTQEPPLRIWGNYNLEYTTPLFTNTTFTLRGQVQSHHSNNHLFTKRDINTITSH